MRFSRRSRHILGALGVAAITAGGVASSSATFVASFPVEQGFSTKADWVQPVVAITSPADGSRTNDATPAVSGQASTAAGDDSTVVVTLWAGGDTSGAPQGTFQAPVEANGTWSVSLALLTEGQYTVRAAQGDAGGNAGNSQAISFVVDLTAPAPTILVPAASATVGTSPEMSGTAGDEVADADSLTLRLWHNASGAGTPDRTLTATRSGTSWSVTAAPPLEAGTWSASVTQGDAAGNSGASPLRVFTVGGAPTLAGLQIRSPRAGASLATGTPAISGRASNLRGASSTVTLKIFSGDAATGAPVRTLTTTRRGRSWSLTVGPPLQDGGYTARAEQADAFGNVTLSDPRSFRVDTLAPDVTINAPLGGALVGRRPGISGVAGTADGDLARVTVRIYGGATPTGGPVQTLRVNRDPASGAWAVTASRLPVGVYTIQASQSDSAGNTGLSSPVTITVSPMALEIEAFDRGGVPGQLQARDRIRFTYNVAMSPSSMLTGWNGASTPIRVRFFNGGNEDGFTLLNAAGTSIVRVTGGSPSSPAGGVSGSGVLTHGNYVLGRLNFDATMVLSSNRRVVIVTLGAPDRPGRIRPGAVRARDMEWTVNAAATDFAGRAVASGTVSENDGDQDF